MNNDLISRSALKKEVENLVVGGAERLKDYYENGSKSEENEWIGGVYDAWEQIVNAPTVITNSVYEAYCALSDEEFEHSDSFWITTPKGKKINFVKDRPQGEWIEKVERRGCFAGDKTVYSYTCPFCGAKEFKKYPFCHCGADMRGCRE